MLECVSRTIYFFRVSDKHIYYKNKANINTSCDLLLRFVRVGNMREGLLNAEY